MQVDEKKVFKRQMYSNDSEVGKMKLQSIKENLYEATTKVVLYSIEMYTKKNLTDWVRTDLLKNLDKANNDLKREQSELELGHIGMFDITNGCSVINDFVRKDCLNQSRSQLDEKIKNKKLQIDEINHKKLIIEEHLEQLKLQITENTEDVDSYNNEFSENIDLDDNEELLEPEEDNPVFFEDDSETFDDDDEDENVSLSEIEIFKRDIFQINDIEDINEMLETLDLDKSAIEKTLKSLEKLRGKNSGSLAEQADNERNALENLRTLRNTVFAHKTEDEQEISLIGSWEPEAGPMYNWATEILNYIREIEKRYRIYALFDDYYASKEGKDKFDGCKVYVQRQIKDLYVNHSNIIFEFAGQLYDRDDDDYNFNRLIENMAINWDTGIRYITVVTNEDIPELNIFFKECLSGTNKYVDYYLVDRNMLRDAYKKNDSVNVDCIYFKLLYHLNSSMDKIYWKGKSYTQKEFADATLYKLIKVKKRVQFNGMMSDYEKYLDGIDLYKWCKEHLLSTYYKGMDDEKGVALSLEMEDAVSAYWNQKENGKKIQLYRKAIKTTVNLYFYICNDYTFSYTRNNGQTLHWKSLADARKYLENARNFKSYSDVLEFVNSLRQSYYFKAWKSNLKKNAE